MTTLGKPVLVSLGIVGVYLVPAEGGCVLVDAGVPGQEDRIFAAMASHGLTPESLRLIFVTHAHGDHVGSLKAIADRSHAPVLVSQIEAPALASGETLHPNGITFAGWLLSKMMGSFVKAASGRPVRPDVEVDDEMRLDAFGVKGRAIHTPGHTSGSLTLLLDTGEAFVGDLCAKFPVLSGGSYVPFFGDSREIVYASWRRLLDAGARTFYSDHSREPIPADVLRDELARAGLS
jgi:glyoxylase-like metal-dependent hydrolase (beta-lactamase superfamily II)